MRRNRVRDVFLCGLVALSVALLPRFALSVDSLARLAKVGHGKYDLESSLGITEAQQLLDGLRATGVRGEEVGVISPGSNLVALEIGARGGIPVADPQLALQLGDPIACRVVLSQGLDLVIIRNDVAPDADRELSCLRGPHVVDGAVAVQEQTTWSVYVVIGDRT
jgi:hypothetical protein